jgi:hypothetical protein
MVRVGGKKLDLGSNIKLYENEYGLHTSIGWPTSLYIILSCIEFVTTQTKCSSTQLFTRD